MTDYREPKDKDNQLEDEYQHRLSEGSKLDDQDFKEFLNNFFLEGDE